MYWFDEYLAGNGSYAETFEAGDLAAPPRQRIAVLTCMDARLDPARLLGLGLGDANVIRNAGGRATDDAIRSLVISQRLLGTNKVLVIHHTDCGMAKFTNEELAARCKAELGVDAGHVDFLPFQDLEESVREDVAILRNSPLIPESVKIGGAIYDVRTGQLRVIVP